MEETLIVPLRDGRVVVATLIPYFGMLVTIYEPVVRHEPDPRDRHVEEFEMAGYPAGI